MPSPFPGMDPYLESTDLWQGLHNSLMTYARDALQAHLAANYVAVLEVRLYLEHTLNGGPRPQPMPDVELLRTGPSRGGRRQAIATATATAIPGHWIPVDPVEVREAYISIRSLPGRELVTTIELLSPANKAAGEGREQYLRKQREVLENRVNLVEIDLLRGGPHALAVAPGFLAHLAPFHYLACVFRRARPHGFEVFPWTVRDPLPAIPIPLAPEDPQISLDLQAVFTQTYDRGAFYKLLDYEQDPDPPLAGDDVTWADALLREAGLRGGDRA